MMACVEFVLACTGGSMLAVDWAESFPGLKTRLRIVNKPIAKIVEE